MTGLAMAELVLDGRASTVAIDHLHFDRFDQRQAMAETLYLGLRTAEGVAEAEFAARFGIGFRDAFGPALEQSPDYLYRNNFV